jgi:hypothetical protein
MYIARMLEPVMHDAFYEMVSCMIRQEPPPGSPERAARAGRVADLLARFG